MITVRWLRTWKVGCLGILSLGCAAVRIPDGARAEGSAERPAERTIFDFATDTDASGWQVEDDVVMGGRSTGRFEVSRDGHGVFSGDVSLENNGGFSSVQYFFPETDIRGYTTAAIRLKGDGKTYRFLTEATEKARHYYVYELPTGTEWETVRIPLLEMFPERRGDRLSLPNFPGETLAQVRFLIGNQRAETFRLEVDRIWLE